ADLRASSCRGRLIFLRLRSLMVNTSNPRNRSSIRERAKADRDNRVINRAGAVAVLGTRGETEAPRLVTPFGYDRHSGVFRDVSRRSPRSMENASMDRTVGGFLVLVLGVSRSRVTQVLPRVKPSSSQDGY